MKKGDTIFLRPDQLASLGINIELVGITGRKARPYVVTARNGHMTWLMPLTTQLKGKHGRIAVVHEMNGRKMECECITTDMISVHTPRFEEIGRPAGVVRDLSRVVDQVFRSLSLGRLGA